MISPPSVYAARAIDICYTMVASGYLIHALCISLFEDFSYTSFQHLCDAHPFRSESPCFPQTCSSQAHWPRTWLPKCLVLVTKDSVPSWSPEDQTRWLLKRLAVSQSYIIECNVHIPVSQISMVFIPWIERDRDGSQGFWPSWGHLNLSVFSQSSFLFFSPLFQTLTSLCISGCALLQWRKS